MPQPGALPRQARDPRRAVAPFRVVLREALGERVRAAVEQVAEQHGVLQRLAGALRRVVQHGVRRVAEQRHPAVGPRVHRVPVHQDPRLPLLAQRQQPLRRLAQRGERPPHGLLVHGHPGDGLGGAVLHAGREVEVGAAGDRVVHEVPSGPGPPGDRVPPQLPRHPLHRDDRPVHRDAGDAWLAVVDELAADRRVDAVRPHHRVARDVFPGAEQHRRGPVVLPVAGGRAAGAQLDRGGVAAGVQQQPVQLTAVHHHVRIAEPAAVLPGQRQAHHMRAGHPVHEPQLVDVHGTAAHRVAEAEAVERVNAVRCELDARAELGEVVAALQHDRPVPAPGDGDGRRKTADAPADHNYPRHAGLLPPFPPVPSAPRHRPAACVAGGAVAPRAPRAPGHPEPSACRGQRAFSPPR